MVNVVIPLSDKHKVQATATFALPALTYHMPIIHWPVNDLKELDRMLRKILNDTKAKHTLLKHYGLVNKIPSWHSAIVPKPEVKNDQVRILWDVPTHTAECRIQATSHQGNMPDVTVFDKQA